MKLFQLLGAVGSVLGLWMGSVWAQDSSASSQTLHTVASEKTSTAGKASTLDDATQTAKPRADSGGQTPPKSGEPTVDDKAQAQQKTRSKSGADSKSMTKPSVFKQPLSTAKVKTEKGRSVTFGGLFLSQAHWRNDTDFDPSARFDDLDGQSEGQIASFLSPFIELTAPGGVRVYYKAELGWNAWSRNTTGQPNQYWASDQPGLVARHREAWGEWSKGAISGRVGFQQIRDPSGLFLDQSIGSAVLTHASGPSRFSVFVGQLADTTLEGVDVRETNFVNDSFIAGARYSSEIGPRGLTLEAANFAAVDERSIGRPLLLNTLILGGKYKSKGYSAWFHGLGQYGRLSKSGINGGDQTIMAWAAQAGAARTQGAWRWSGNVLALSADDDHHGNEHMGAFWGSGRNASQTRLLTEDEFRDRYDNFDERASTIWGSYFINRAGLLLSELSLGYEISRRYRPRLVVAGAMALNPKNALGGRFFGLEASLLQSIHLSRHARVEVNLLTLLPGPAAAAMINDVDRKATEILYGINLGFALTF